jgi:hypothetical protein
MKKRVLLLSIFALLIIGLAFFANNLLSNSGRSNTSLNDYAIEDTASVDRIKISMSNAFTIDLKRNGAHWETFDGNCIQQEPVNNMLHTFKNIAIKAYVPKSAIENTNKAISIN